MNLLIFILLILFIFLRKKKELIGFQPFVCPCDAHCDSEHKQINLYLDKEFHGKSFYAILNRKELGELLHCLCSKNKKKLFFVTTAIITFIAKKIKHIRERLDNAYYFSSRKDAPWQRTR